MVAFDSKEKIMKIIVKTCVVVFEDLIYSKY